MARSRQTAFKFTGGKAPHKELARKAARQTKAAADQERVRPHRYLPGTVGFCEIRKCQKFTELLMPKAPFQRAVREIAEARMQGVRFQARAVKALQLTAEAFLVEQFEEAQRCAIHAKRVTIYPKDIYLAARMIRAGHFVLREYINGRK